MRTHHCEEAIASVGRNDPEQVCGRWPVTALRSKRGTPWCSAAGRSKCGPLSTKSKLLLLDCSSPSRPGTRRTTSRSSTRPSQRWRHSWPFQVRTAQLRSLIPCSEWCCRLRAASQYPFKQYIGRPSTRICSPVGAESRVESRHQRLQTGILNNPDGKTCVAKGTVCVAHVPLLFGTDAFTDFILVPPPPAPGSS